MRSQAVNALIGQIKVHKVRRTGAGLQARRAFSLEEFLTLLSIVQAITNDDEKSSCFRSLATLQWQLIGRVDDMQKLQVNNILFSSIISQGVVFCLRWSKNIGEERAAPLQVMFGSGSKCICALLCLVSHLKVSMDPTTSSSSSFSLTQVQR